MLFCVACGKKLPSSAEHAKAKMQSLGYSVTVKMLENDEFASLGATALVQCVKNGDSGFVSMTGIIFETKSKAKNYVKDMKEANDLFGAKTDMKNVGRWVLEGDEEAINDFQS